MSFLPYHCMILTHHHCLMVELPVSFYCFHTPMVFNHSFGWVSTLQAR